VRERVLTLRIGGNDLFRLLGVRRSVERTVYETVLGPVISSLVTTFRPWGIPLCAPVFEGLAQPDVLRREVEADLMHGLFGKTAVHPSQIGIIHDLYRVSQTDLEMAQRLDDALSPAVFSMHGTMCEKAVHLDWARATLHRATLFGVHGQTDAADDDTIAALTRAVSFGSTTSSVATSSPHVVHAARRLVQ
jgi:citrate lyase beta subunit